MEDLTLYFNKKVVNLIFSSSYISRLDSKTSRQENIYILIPTIHNSLSQEIILSSKFIFNFLFLNPSQIKNNDEVMPSNDEFTIIDQQNPDSKGPLTFGTSVCLLAK